MTDRWQVRETAAGPRLQLWCLACASVHEVGEQWSWSIVGGPQGSLTISPSILVLQDFHESSGLSQRRCHSFVRDSQWEYLEDSTHASAGQTVPLAPLPDWLLREAAGS